jgi:hypothetical protein
MCGILAPLAASRLLFLQRWEDLLDDAGTYSHLEPHVAFASDVCKEGGSDDEYGRRKKRRKKAAPPAEHTRGDLHILDENMELLLSGSFDASQFGSGLGDHDRSSSQADAAMGFDIYQNDLFQQADNFDLGEIGDELAQELGEGWATAPPTQQPSATQNE